MPGRRRADRLDLRPRTHPAEHLPGRTPRAGRAVGSSLGLGGGGRASGWRNRPVSPPTRPSATGNVRSGGFSRFFLGGRGRPAFGKLMPRRAPLRTEGRALLNRFGSLWMAPPRSPPNGRRALFSSGPNQAANGSRISRSPKRRPACMSSLNRVFAPHCRAEATIKVS